MSDYKINLDKEYEVERSKGSSKDVEDTFVREVEALFTLKHPFILSLKGYCLPKGDKGAKLITGSFSGVVK
jgi:hypothetical protein